MYNNEELKTLLTVALLNKYGYKISRIDEMPPEQRVNVVLNLQEAEAKQEHIVNELISCMVELNNVEFEKKLNDFISTYGIAQTVQSLILQFLEKVGILWQTNKINIAQEHVVSNIIRQKIISALEQQPAPNLDHDPIVLFLPENEHHELGLLFIYYLLKRNRVPVIYLGATVPLKDVHYVIEKKNPKSLYLHLTSFPRQLQLEKYLHQLSGIARKANIFISGSVTSTYSRSLPANVTFLKSISEVDSYISSL
jgi:methanogenic corrinoid protein MtbC1